MARSDVDTGAPKYLGNSGIPAILDTVRDNSGRESHATWRMVKDLATLPPALGGTHQQGAIE